MKTLLCALSLTVVGLAVAPRAAHAQVTVTTPAQRTWISGVGDDVNADDAQGNCSRTAPCKTFSGAMIATAPGGEINCLDHGGFGALTITQSVSIVCKAKVGSILSGGPTAVDVILASASDAVVLDGLEMDAGAPATGTNGVRMRGAGTLIIRNALIRNFLGYGVVMQGTAGASVLIEDTVITKSGLGGIQFNASAGAANFVQLNRVSLINNGAAGVKLTAGGTLFVSGSSITGSTLAIDNTSGGSTTSFANNVLSPVPQLTVAPLR